MIKSVRIQNFKSLRDVQVELGALTVLIGRSGTGKTNFVNAFAFFRDCLVQGHGAVGHWGGAERLLCATAPRPEVATGRPRIEFDDEAPSKRSTPACAPYDNISFLLRFDAPGFEADFLYELQIAPRGGPAFVAREALSYGGAEIFSRADNRWVTEPAVVPLPESNKLALHTANGIPEVARAYFVLTEGIGCYNFQGTVLQQRALQQPVRKGKRRETVGLAGDANNYLEVFQDINRNLQDVEAQKQIIAAMRQLNFALTNVQVAMPDRDKVNVSLSAGDRTLTLDLSQESEGFRRFLAHLIAIYQLPPKQVLVFDEPEKGLYPGALAALAGQLRACPGAGRGQVILTTHNPALLDHFQPEEIRVVEIDRFETKIGLVSNPQLEAAREQLLTTGELLTVDPARMEAASGQPT